MVRVGDSCGWGDHMSSMVHAFSLEKSGGPSTHARGAFAHGLRAACSRNNRGMGIPTDIYVGRLCVECSDEADLYGASMEDLDPGLNLVLVGNMSRLSHLRVSSIFCFADIDFRSVLVIVRASWASES